VYRDTDQEVLAPASVAYRTTRRQTNSRSVKSRTG